MDLQLENELLAVARHVRMLNLNTGTVEQVRSAVVTFEHTLKKAAYSTKWYLCDVYRNELSHVRATLQQISDPCNTSLWDGIVKLLPSHECVSHRIAYLFEQFIKGITYFTWQQDLTHPFYHRLDACDRAVWVEYDKKRYQELADRCYIEYLILKNICEHLCQTTSLPLQVKNTRKDLQFQIHVSYTEDMPTKLVVKRVHKDTLVSTETYEKRCVTVAGGNREYEDFVTCTRCVDDKVMKKVQSFKIESVWVLHIKPQSAF
jgi:hypothetical protein